jgi:hypothetical protein
MTFATQLSAVFTPIAGPSTKDCAQLNARVIDALSQISRSGKRHKMLGIAAVSRVTFELSGLPRF